MLSRTTGNGFARQDPVTTDNEMEEIAQNQDPMNAEAGNTAAQPDQPDLDEPGRQKANAGSML
jgi:hypothetical protein